MGVSEGDELPLYCVSRILVVDNAPREEYFSHLVAEHLSCLAGAERVWLIHAVRRSYLTMLYHVVVLNALGRTFICSLFIACVLCAAGAMPARAQGDVDEHTLLLLHFENSLIGAQGETASSSGVTFESGIAGQGVFLDGFDTLSYQTTDNFNMSAGTIEFWVKPRWNSVSPFRRDFVTLGPASAPQLAVFRSVSGPLRFVIGADDSEAGKAGGVVWNSNQWHYIAVTWTIPGRMIIYIDGIERANYPSSAQDLLSPLPGQLNVGSGGNRDTASVAVIDELRISDVARTPGEIAARYASFNSIKSLSLKVVTQNLWKTWRIKPTLTADTNLGSLLIPSTAATWSSSNPGVATVNAAGEIVGNGAGTAVLTATYEGAQGSVNVNVRAPALEPRVEVASDYLATPAAGALYEMPVVILRYLPTADGANLDVAWAPDYFSLNPIPLTQLEQNLNKYDQIIKFMLEEGSRFRGYGSQSPPPSLGYRVVAVITVYEPSPPGKSKVGPGGMLLYDANWFQIFERFNLKSYIEGMGVKEVWYYTGGVQPNIPSYDPAIHPPENMREGWESNMSSPTTGDISNSNRDNSDLPIYDHTYIVYFRNIRRLDPTTIHGDGHQLESMLADANFRQDGNTQLLWQKFAGLTPDGDWQRGRCGDVHHPPNALDDYDYGNFTPYDSDIMDWRPDGGGQVRPFSAETLLNTPYRFPNDFLEPSPLESFWHIFWRQSWPGRGNTIQYGSNRLTNWWQFVGDWDAATRAGLGLYEPASCGFSLSGAGQSFAAAGGAGEVSVTAGSGCRWLATSNAPWIKITSGDTSANGNSKVNFSVATNDGRFRSATLVLAGQPFTVTQAPGLAPALFTEEASPKALALDSVTLVRDPFSVLTGHNFSQDQRRRVALFTTNAELLPGENVSALKVLAEDSQHRVFPLTVEYVGRVPGYDWLTQINVKLPDELENAGDVSLSINLRGLSSNKAMLSIGPSP